MLQCSTFSSAVAGKPECVGILAGTFDNLYTRSLQKGLKCRLLAVEALALRFHRGRLLYTDFELSIHPCEKNQSSNTKAEFCINDVSLMSGAENDKDDYDVTESVSEVPVIVRQFKSLSPVEGER